MRKGFAENRAREKAAGFELIILFSHVEGLPFRGRGVRRGRGASDAPRYMPRRQIDGSDCPAGTRRLLVKNQKAQVQNANLGCPAGQSTAILVYRKRAARTLFVRESFRVVAFALACGLSGREFQETCSHIHCIRIR